MRFLTKKRAAIEVQFNWIFVLIVGALILVFFINISNAQRKNAEQTLAFELLSKVDLIMSGALTIPKTGQIFDMPNIDFNTECNRISTLGVSRQFPDRIVFAPDTLKGKKLIVWSQDWNVPYKVTNFLYMTTSNVRYVVVAEDPANTDAINFVNALPDNITKEISALSSITDKNNYKIKLIFLDSIYSNLDNDALSSISLPDWMQKMANSAVTGVYIRKRMNPADVRFIRKNGNHLEYVGDEVKVYKDPMIFGAVFAENKEEFNCSITKAFKKLHYVSEVYAKREDALISAYGQSTMEECKSPVTRANSEINAIANAALDKEIETISGNENIVYNNNQMALKASCAPIY